MYPGQKSDVILSVADMKISCSLLVCAGPPRDVSVIKCLHYDNRKPAKWYISGKCPLVLTASCGKEAISVDCELLPSWQN